MAPDNARGSGVAGWPFPALWPGTFENPRALIGNEGGCDTCELTPENLRYVAAVASDSRPHAQAACRSSGARLREWTAGSR
jgi:hypothetical protein